MSATKEMRERAALYRRVYQQFYNVPFARADAAFYSSAILLGYSLLLHGRDAEQIKDDSRALLYTTTSRGEEAAALIDWDTNGAPTFVLEPGVVTAFSMTDVDNIRCDDVNLPFSSFVVLPSPDQSPLVFSPERVSESSEGYVIALEALSKGTISSLVVTRRRIPASMLEAHRTIIQLTKLKTHEDWYNARSNYDGCDSLCIYGKLTNNTSMRFVLPLIPGRTLGDVVAELPGHQNTSDEDSLVNLGMLVRRLVTSLMLYLDNSGLSMGKEGTSWRDKVKSYKNSPNACIWKPATEIRLDRTVRDAATAEALQYNAPALWKLQSEIVVRGHWRMQRVGKGLTDTKRVWIAPYTKGEGLPKQIEKVYTTTNTLKPKPAALQ